MSRRCSSVLVTMFLQNVREGTIVGRKNSSGPEALALMAEALEQVLNGTPPAKALEVRARPGRLPASRTAEVATMIAQMRRADEKWAVVELEVNAWLRRRRLDPISVARMKQIHKDASRPKKLRGHLTMWRSG